MILGYEKSFLEKKKGYITAKEIAQQPRLWNETTEIISENHEKIKNFLDSMDLKNTKIIFTGAGTSEFVGNTLTPYMREITQLDIESRATTDIVANPLAYIPTNKDVLLVSFARSGNSPESIAAVEIAEQVSTRVSHLFLTCNPEGKLAKKKLKNSLTILMPVNSNDAGFAMTGSFSCMLLAASMIFQLENIGKIKKEVKILVETSENNIVSLREKLLKIVNLPTERVVFLGAASLKGLAQELSLKVLELCAGNIPSTYDTPLGFRHGPKSIVNNNTVIFNLLSTNEYSKKYDIDLINEIIRDKKATVITIGHCDSVKNENINLNTNFFSKNMILQSLSYLIPAQMYSFMKSLEQEITPDNPCPSGEVNRVVQGVIIHEYNR